jgi:hypothetical protein
VSHKINGISLLKLASLKAEEFRGRQASPTALREAHAAGCGGYASQPLADAGETPWPVVCSYALELLIRVSGYFR